MNRRIWLLASSAILLCLFVFPAISLADTVVFSNLGPGNSYIGPCTCGWGVGAGWYGSVAVPFTPSTNVELSQIFVALTTANTGTLELVDDNAGTPGTTILDSWNISTLPPWQGPSTIQPTQTFTADPGVDLTGGAQYWIVAQTNNSFIWLPNNLGQWQVNGQFPVCSNGCTNEFNTQYAPAFEVTGVAEPSSLVLLFIGFAMLPLFPWLARIQAHNCGASRC